MSGTKELKSLDSKYCTVFFVTAELKAFSIPVLFEYLNYRMCGLINSRSFEEKIVTRTLEGEINRTPLLSTFDKIHRIDMKLSTYNKFHLYFQLSKTTWCLVGFHGNDSQINDVTSGRHLGFLKFLILFKFKFL